MQDLREIIEALNGILDDLEEVEKDGETQDDAQSQTESVAKETGSESVKPSESKNKEEDKGHTSKGKADASASKHEPQESSSKPSQEEKPAPKQESQAGKETKPKAEDTNDVAHTSNDVIELTKLEKDLIGSKIESGLRNSGVEMEKVQDFIEEFVDLGKFKDGEADDVDMDEINRFVAAIAGIVSVNPPKAPKRKDTSSKASGFGKYIEKG